VKKMKKSKISAVVRVCSLLHDEGLQEYSVSLEELIKRGYDAGYRDGKHDIKKEDSG